MSASSIRAARAFVELYADLNGLEAGLVKARGMLRGFSRSVAASGLGTLRIGASILAPLTAAGALAVKASADFEQTKIALEALIGDVGKAAAVLREADKYAAQTSFGLADVTAAIRALKGYEVATSDVMRVTRTLGNISAATGVPLSELAEVYGRNSQQGQVLTKDVREFASRGIPVLTELTKRFGDVYQAASEGRITFADIDSALEAIGGKGGKWADMTLAQSKSLNGVLSIAVDQFLLVARAIGDVMLPTVKDFVNFSIGAANAVTDWVTANKGLVSLGVYAAIVIAGVGAAISAAGVAMIVVGGAASAMAGALSLAIYAVAAFASAVALVAGAPVLFSAIAVAIAAAVAATVVFRAELVGAIGSAMSFIGDAISARLGWIVDVFGVSWGKILALLGDGKIGEAASLAMLSAETAMAVGMDRMHTAWLDFRVEIVAVFAEIGKALASVMTRVASEVLSQQSRMLSGMAAWVGKLGAIGAPLAGALNTAAAAANASGVAAGVAGSGINAALGAQVDIAAGESARQRRESAVREQLAREILRSKSRVVVRQFAAEESAIKSGAKAAASSPVSGGRGAASVFGSFSAFGLRAGVGNSAANRTAAATEQTAKNTKRIAEREAVFE